MINKEGINMRLKKSFPGTALKSFMVVLMLILQKEYLCFPV